MKAIIEVVAGKDKGKQFPIKENQLIVFGRTEWSDIPFPSDPQMSGKHFSLENDGQKIMLRDLGSTNGTKVNGEFVESAGLKDGDQVDAGLTTFSIRVEAAAEAPMPAPTGGVSAFPATPPPPAESHINQPPPTTVNPSSPISSPIVYHGSSPVAPSASPAPTPPPAHGTPVPSSPVEPSSPIVLPQSSPAQSSAESPPSSSPIASPINQPPVSPPPVEPTPDSRSSAGHSAVTSPPPVQSPVAPSPVAPSPVAQPPVAPSQSPVAPPAAPPTTPPPQSSPVASDPVPPAVGSSPIAQSPVASPVASPQAESKPAANHDGREMVYDQRRPKSYIGSKDVVKQQLAGGLYKYASQPAEKDDPAAFFPSSVIKLLSGLGAPIAVVHYQKAGKECSEQELKKSTPLFGWLPNDIARAEGPVLYTSEHAESIFSHLDELWDADAAVGFFCSDSESAAQKLQNTICPPNKSDDAPSNVVGLCWPSVCEALLEQAKPETWQQFFGAAITAVFMEPASKKGAFLIFSVDDKPDAVFSQAGFNLIEPANP